MAVVVGGSLLLYAVRAPTVKSSATFELVSRESVILLNNVLLVVTASSILLGTLYPLVIDALGLGKISVGPPYFNAIFIPLMAPLALAVGFGMLLRWKKRHNRAVGATCTLDYNGLYNRRLATAIINACLFMGSGFRFNARIMDNSYDGLIFC